MLTFVDGSKLSKETRNCWTIIAPHEACHSRLSLSTCTHPLELFSGKWPLGRTRFAPPGPLPHLQHLLCAMPLKKCPISTRRELKQKYIQMSTKPLLEIQVYKILGYNNERLVVSFCLCLTASIFVRWMHWLQSMYGSPPPWEWPLMTWMCWTWCTPNRLHKSTWRLAEIMMRGKSDMYTCCTQWWPYAMPSLLSSLVCMPACPQACMSVCLYARVNVNVHIQVCKCKVAKKLIPQFRSLHVVLRQIEAPSRVHRYWY